MISECLNPICRKELLYLRDGRVVRVVRNSTDEVEVEHFWLCGSCYASNDFHFGADGSVTVERRAHHAPVGDLETWLDPTLVA